MQRTSVASHGTIGIALVLVVWAVLFVVNVLELAPSIHFRGIRFSGGDFGQYFMGGVVANERIWDDLYPIDLATVPSPDKASIAPRLADALYILDDKRSRMLRESGFLPRDNLVVVLI